MLLAFIPRSHYVVGTCCRNVLEGAPLYEYHLG